jgi:hypothetical protein
MRSDHGTPSAPVRYESAPGRGRERRRDLADAGGRAPPVQLTRDGCEKGRLAAWSPDGTKIAYYTNTTMDKPRCPTEVVLLETDGTRLKALRALDRGNAVRRIDWLGNDRIGIDTHINPSLGQYRIMDVATGKELASYSGYGFRARRRIPNISHTPARRRTLRRCLRKVTILWLTM